MAKWLLIPLGAAVLTSCKKEEPPTESPPTVERKLPSPTKIEPVAELDPAPKQQESPPPDSPKSPADQTTNVPPKQTPAAPPSNPGYPSATAVAGKSGYVTSPYSGKIIDVRDMPPGTLVQDPTFPASEKKYFRVP